MPSTASSSSAAQKTSKPPLTSGQATSDGRPAFSPAMIEPCGPGTSVISPARADSSTQAAAAGSIPASRGRPGQVPRRRRGERAHADRHERHVDRPVRACSSTSWKIVA